MESLDSDHEITEPSIRAIATYRCGSRRFCATARRMQFGQQFIR